jgi:hypothetical protein
MGIAEANGVAPGASDISIRTLRPLANIKPFVTPIIVRWHFWARHLNLKCAGFIQKAKNVNRHQLRPAQCENGGCAGHQKYSHNKRKILITS